MCITSSKLHSFVFTLLAFSLAFKLSWSFISQWLHWRISCFDFPRFFGSSSVSPRCCARLPQYDLVTSLFSIPPYVKSTQSFKKNTLIVSFQNLYLSPGFPTSTLAPADSRFILLGRKMSIFISSHHPIDIS